MKFGLLTEEIESINKIFSEFPAISKVILYGSRAKGNYRPASDIDLTIEGEGFDLSDLFDLENRLDDILLPYKIDLSIKKHIDNQELLDHINRVGEIFYIRVNA
ncbi:nucleotidyltransferase family protein [Echinicola shivajiensis]|uniref:nucleotidyltransferase family protein n=1 Tax=Echinicola shivajiensis TaxID=1035916 RepID=UPI001BFC4ABA|nr:nucleotidyltransferase domain-containing protein [Echinicola shivajiensis]